MSTPTDRGKPMARRKPELVSVRVVPWDEGAGLYGMVYEFDDGEAFGEMWGTREQTELAARIRKLDIRVSHRPIVG